MNNNTPAVGKRLTDVIERALSSISGSVISLSDEPGLTLISATKDPQHEGCINIEIKLDNAELVDEASDYIHALNPDYLSENDVTLFDGEDWIEATFVHSSPGVVVLFDSRNMGKRKCANVTIGVSASPLNEEKLLNDYKRRAVDICIGPTFDLAQKIENGEVAGANDPVVLQRLYELSVEASEKVKAMLEQPQKKRSPSL